MVDKIRFSVFCLAFAFAGCGTRSGLTVREAGTSPDLVVVPDSASANPDAPPDILLRDDGLPDLLVMPDMLADVEITRRDVPVEYPPDLIPPSDPGRDGALRDGPIETTSRDSTLLDVVTPSDRPAQDFPGDRPPSDAGVPEVARDGSPEVAGDVSSEAGREVQPFVVDGGLASFCSGDTPHMVVNGIESNPSVVGRVIPYDCCDGGQFTVTTQTFAYPIVISWRSQLGAGPTPPATVDLANPPSNWSVRVVAGCDPMLSSCTGPGDGYTSGLEGMLQVALAAYQFDMSLCLHIVEPAGSSHPLVHTLDLYAPHVVTTY
jgi:hypothetical protein